MHIGQNHISGILNRYRIGNNVVQRRLCSHILLCAIRCCDRLYFFVHLKLRILNGCLRITIFTRLLRIRIRANYCVADRLALICIQYHILICNGNRLLRL